MLTDACRVRDLTGVRHVVAAYGAWLMSLPAPEAIVATVDNTVCRTDGDSVTFGLFDPSWTVSVETTRTTPGLDGAALGVGEHAVAVGGSGGAGVEVDRVVIALVMGGLRAGSGRADRRTAIQARVPGRDAHD